MHYELRHDIQRLVPFVEEAVSYTIYQACGFPTRQNTVGRKVSTASVSETASGEALAINPVIQQDIASLEKQKDKKTIA